MKKIFLILLFLCVLLLIFRYSLFLAFIEGSVNGKKIASFNVSGSVTHNGFRYFEISKPYLYIGGEPDWKKCDNLTDKFSQMINNISGGKPKHSRICFLIL